MIHFKGLKSVPNSRILKLTFDDLLSAIKKESI